MVRSSYLDRAFISYVTAAACKAIKDHTELLYVKDDVIIRQNHSAKNTGFFAHFNIDSYQTVPCERERLLHPLTTLFESALLTHQTVHD